MKKVNNMTVFEPKDKCSLDEYSGRVAIEVPMLIEKEKEEINKKVINISENDIKQDSEIAILKTNCAKLEEQVKKDRNNMINLTAEGHSIHIEDSSDLEAELEILGNSKQETRQGYNLIKKEGFSTPRTYANFWSSIASNFTPLTDGWGKADFDGKQSTQYCNSWIKAEGLNIKPDTEYTIIFEVRNKSGNIYLVFGGANNESFFETSVSNISSNGIYKFKVMSKSDITNTKFRVYANSFNSLTQVCSMEYRAMIVEGDHTQDALEYEQYGKSPSVEYLQEIESTGSNINIYDKSTMPVELGGYSGSTGNKYSSTTRIRNVNDILLKAGTYTISAEESSNVSVYIVSLAKEVTSPSKSVTFTLSQDSAIRFTIENKLLLESKIKIEKGTRATSYSLYNFGSVGINITNKNSYNNLMTIKNGLWTSGNVVGRNGNGWYIVIPIVGGKNYYISRKNTKSINSALTLGAMSTEDYPSVGKNVIDNWKTASDGKELQIQTSKSANYLFIGVAVGNATTVTEEIQKLALEELQVEVSEIKTKYVQGQKQDFVLQIPKGYELDGIEETRDYFHKAGAKWYKHKKIETIEVDGEKYGTNFMFQNGFFLIYDMLRNKVIDNAQKTINQKAGKVLCTILTSNSQDNLLIKNQMGCSLNQECKIGLKLDATTNENNFWTKEKVNQFFKDKKVQGKPVVLKYVLKTPQEIEIIDQTLIKQLELLNKVQVYKTITTITTDSIANIRIEYIADTKTYIDNKTNTLEQQLNTINKLLSTTKTSSVLLDNLQTDIESEVL